jgi:cytoskeletal protein CcmA (bactofilin family)
MGFFKELTGDSSKSIEDDAALGATADAEASDFDVDEELLDSLLATSPEAEANDAAAQLNGVPEEDLAVAISNDAQTAKSERTDLSEEDKRATTVITKGTTINGSIISDCSLDVQGIINGDVECIGKLTISGKVVGNSTASEVFVSTDKLQGNINSEGAVKIGLGTVVIGDVFAASGVIAGAIKGEIDVTGPLILDSTAIIKGNVKAKAVQMNNGAVLEGFCSLTYADVDIDTIFE